MPMNDERTPAEPEVMEPTFWRKNGWTARVLKNEEDDGWAVEIAGVVSNHTDFADSSPFEEDQGVARDPQRHAGEHQTELRAIVQSIRFGEPTT